MVLIQWIVLFAIAVLSAAGLIALYDANVDQQRINRQLHNDIEGLRDQLRDFLNSDLAWMYDLGRQDRKENPDG